MKGKPKLLAVVQLPPPYHGVTVANQRLLDGGFLERDFDVEVIPVRVADSLADLGRLSLRKLWRVAKPFIRLARSLRHADIVYYTPGNHGLPLIRDALMMLLCRTTRIPYVLHLHNGGMGFDEARRPFPWYLRFAVARFIPQAARIILLGDSVHRGYAPYMRAEQPYSNVGNGVDIPAAGHSLPPGPLRLGYINNLIRIKGVIHAVRCLAHVPDVHLDVVGAFSDPDYEELIRGEIRALGLEERIHFHGPHFGDAAWDKLSRCHVLLYTSDWREGFPLVWLEAMARAKVVLTSRIGVADDVVGRIDRKLVVPAGDVEAMARIVIALRDDRPGLERLSRTGQALLAREFTVEAWSERVTAALRRTLDDAATTQRRPA